MVDSVTLTVARVPPQLDIYHAILLRSYMRKYDMEEPPTFEDGDHTEHYRQKHVKDDPLHLEERFYRWAGLHSAGPGLGWGGVGLTRPLARLEFN